MNMTPPDATPIEPADAPLGGETAAMAEAIVTHRLHDLGAGGLVIAARTENGSFRTYGGDSLGPVRASVAVAVAAGNSRLWEGAVGTDTVEQPVSELPEVIRASARAGGLTHAYVGCIEDETVAAVAVWFEVDGAVAGPDRRREAMELLAAAAQRQADFFKQRTQAATDKIAADAAAAGPVGEGDRTFDATDPKLDATTGLATRAEFESALEDFEADEATLVVVDIDDFADLTVHYDTDVLDQVARAVADRLVGTCRGSDLIARLDEHSYAILLHEATRAVGLQVAKRLLDTVAKPLDVDSGPDNVTATVALAHQFGLVDMEELVESADLAVASGQRAGRGRLVIAS